MSIVLCEGNAVVFFRNWLHWQAWGSFGGACSGAPHGNPSISAVWSLSATSSGAAHPGSRRKQAQSLHTTRLMSDFFDVNASAGSSGDRTERPNCQNSSIFVRWGTRCRTKRENCQLNQPQRNSCRATQPSAAQLVPRNSTSRRAPAQLSLHPGYPRHPIASSATRAAQPNRRGTPCSSARRPA